MYGDMKCIVMHCERTCKLPIHMEEMFTSTAAAIQTVCATMQAAVMPYLILQRFGRISVPYLRQPIVGFLQLYELGGDKESCGESLN